MKTRAFENPLLPNARLREMYSAMVEVRALGEAIHGCALGSEACWVAPVVDLLVGDLTSVPAGAGGVVVSYVRARGSLPVKSLARAVAGEIGDGCLRAIGDGSQRIWAALGAGLALRAAGQSGVVVVYAEAGELASAEWKRVFSAASASEVPLLFVMLPDAGEVLDVSQRCGVPAIPVEAHDAIAMYRVTQESLVRARMGGGPALLGCVRLPGGEADAIALLAGQLKERRVATTAWMDAVEAKFRARLEKASVTDVARRARQIH